MLIVLTIIYLIFYEYMLSTRCVAVQAGIALIDEFPAMKCLGKWQKHDINIGNEIIKSMSSVLRMSWDFLEQINRDLGRGLSSQEAYGHVKKEYSQEELLVPDWVQVSKDGFRPAFGLAHLNSDIGVTGARFVLGL